MNDAQLPITAALIFFWLVPSSAWWMLNGRQDHGARLWFSGVACHALSVTIRIFTLPQGGPALWSVAVYCSMLSTVLMIEALRLETHARPAPRPFLKVALAVGIPMVLLIAIDFKSGALARAIYLLCQSLLNIWLIYLTWRLQCQWRSKALDIVFLVSALFVASNLTRILEWVFTAQLPPIWNATPLTSIAVALNSVSFVFYSFGYWGFVLEKSQHLVETSKRLAIEAAAREREARTRETLAVEREHLLTRMVELGRLAQAGAVSASIAHEINQPLASVRLSLESALVELGRITASARLKRLLHRANAENIRTAEIIQRIRDLFQSQPARMTPQVVDALIHNVLGLLQQNPKAEGVKITTVLHAPASILLATGELEHVLLNLLDNALDSVNAASLSRKAIGIATGQEQDHTWIRVSDNGSGIPPELRENLFDPAISTKSGGMGMGLWLAKHIVQRNGGRLHLNESSAEGASFTIELPTSGEKPAL